jgi:hypothetical protein
MAAEFASHGDDALEDLTISAFHRGDIVCRKLIVMKGGTVSGYIEADEVRNMGRIRGVVNAKTSFVNSEGAKVFGNVFSASFGVHPKSTWEVASSHSAPFARDAALGVPHASAIEQAVDEGVQRVISTLRSNPSPTPVETHVETPAEVSATTAAPVAVSTQVAVGNGGFLGFDALSVEDDEALVDDIAATLLEEMATYANIDVPEEAGAEAAEEPVDAPPVASAVEAAATGSTPPLAIIQAVVPDAPVRSAPAATPTPIPAARRDASPGAVRAVTLPPLFASAR